MKKLTRAMILVIIVCILILMARGIYRENKIKKADGNLNMNLQKEQKNEIQENNTSNPKTEAKNKVIDLVQEEYKGYKVAAKLEIKKLNINTCVLEEYTKSAMQICVTKFFGPAPNEVGNFCITGHNYITKNMFGYLYKLKTGDTFTLTDNKNGTVEYKVYDQYRAEADQTYRTITSNKWKKRSNIGNLL